MATTSADGPAREEFGSLEASLVAHEQFHDDRAPTDLQTLERSVRFAREAVRGVELQLRRVRGVEPEDDEWLFRVWTDIQFLITALWQLRLAARLAASTDLAADVATRALNRFDDRLPDLATMRHVAQHLDAYAVDDPNRRQRRPNGVALVGRRSLEVGSWSDERFIWLGGSLDVGAAETESRLLYSALRTAAEQVCTDSAEAPGQPHEVSTDPRHPC